MTFNSFEFLIFYPAVLLLYFVLPKSLRPWMLLCASYYFYACSQLELLFLIVATTLVSYFSALGIERTERAWLKKALLALTLTVSLGVLFFYKYFNFIFGSAVGLVSLFGGELSAIELNLILPVGISFYTFQTLSYVIDVYRRDIPAERSFLYYALFVSFFPQLVAGPIERPSNLLPQLKSVSASVRSDEKDISENTEGYTAYKWNKDDSLKGAKLMLLGFFKKIAVADLISVYVNSVYNSPESASSLGVIIATCLFAVQIYCDFSGYTDIAIGASRIMGIRLMKNFDHPYSAASIREFWSRWHISLSTWFKDYLYFPLGGSRCKSWRHLLNLMIVFLVSGLWHGAAWTFVIWGALHGLYQVIGVLTRKPRAALVERLGFSEDSMPVIIVRRIITFILVAFAWIFFRANSLSDAFILLSKLFDFEASPFATLEAMGLGWVQIIVTVLSIAVLILLERMITYEDTEDSSDLLTKNGSFIYFVWLILLAWLLLLSKGMSSTFIYFQF